MDQALISLVIAFLEIIEQPPSLSYELKETAARVMILDMDLKVLGEVLNTLTQQGYLNLRRAGILLMELELLNDPVLLFLSNSHFFSVRLLFFLSC